MGKVAWTSLLIVFLTLFGLNSAEAEKTVYAGGLLDELNEPLVEAPPTRRPADPSVRPQVPPDRPIRHEPLVGLPEVSPPRRPTPPRPQRYETPAQFRRFQQYDVWEPFYQKFKKCEPDCEPRVNNLYREDDPRCHGVGRAIDIDAVVCPNGTHDVFRGRHNPRFEQMVRCMRDQQRMLTIWKNKDPHRYGVTQSHHDHVHFGIGCHSGY